MIDIIHIKFSKDNNFYTPCGRKLFNISTKLKEIKSKSNMTQTAFAKKIGIAQSTLIEILKGNSYPKDETLNKIVSSLNVTLEELIGESDVI